MRTQRVKTRGAPYPAAQQPPEDKTPSAFSVKRLNLKVVSFYEIYTRSSFYKGPLTGKEFGTLP